MCSITGCNSKGYLVPRSTNQLLALSMLVVVIGYSSFGVVSATSIRHRTREAKDSDMPTFKATTDNITVHPGDRAVLRCRVENLRMKTVSWRKQGEMNPLTIGYFTFSPDTRISLDYNQRNREWSLIIQAVRPEDEGWYHCQVTTKLDNDLYYPIKLNVLTVQVTGNDYVVVGQHLRLMCNATGKPDPPHNVDWFKDNRLLTSDAETGIIITKKIETKVLVSVLVIKEIKLTDKGVYLCRSSNQDAAEFELNVLDPAMTSHDKRDPGQSRLGGQHNSPYRESEYRDGRNSSPSWLHRKSTYILPVVCFSVGLLFQDTRWQS